MASRYDASDIHELTECPVCLDRFSQTKTPKFLSCTHNVCVQCVRGIAKGQRLLCPVCRRETNVPQGDVTNIPTNRGILQIAELKPLAKCEACGSEGKNSKCFHCEEHVCVKCLDKHTQDTQIEIRKYQDDLTKSKNNIDKFQNRINSNMVTVKDRVKSNIDEIHETFRILTQSLKQRRDLLIGQMTTFQEDAEDEYNQLKQSLSDCMKKISPVLNQMQTFLPNVRQHLTKTSIADIKRRCPKLLQELEQNVGGCSITFPQIDVNTKIDGLMKEIKKWGVVTSFKNVTVKYSPPVDYTKRGQLVRRVDTWQSGGRQQKFGSIRGIAVDAVSGEVFVADGKQNRIHVFTSLGQHVRSFGGTGRSQGQFNSPYGICLNSDRELIVCDTHNNRCQILTLAGEYIRQLEQHGPGDEELGSPIDVTVDDRDNIYLNSYDDHNVKVYNKYDIYRLAFGTKGNTLGQFIHPCYIQWSRGMCAVCDHNGVQLWSDQGKFIRSIVRRTDQEPLVHPEGVAADQNGNILVIDAGDHTVKVYNAGGEYVTKFPVAECQTTRGNWCFLKCTPDGAIIISDTNSASLLFY